MTDALPLSHPVGVVMCVLTSESDGFNAFSLYGLSDQTLTLEFENPMAAIDESSLISTTQIEDVAFITV